MEDQVKEIKKTTKTKRTTKKATSKKDLNKKNELKKKSREIEVEVMNVTDGAVYYRDREGTELDIEYTGDTDVVSLKFLEKAKRDILEKLYVTIVDIYDEDYTVEDVVSYLGLDKLYCEKHLTLEVIDEILINSTPDEFGMLLKGSNKALVIRLCERASRLAEENKFDSLVKRTMLEDFTGNKYIFNAY